MAFKVKIDNVEYDLKDNFTIKDELNETLDSATIQFNTYGQEANFESFDVAQIYDSENAITKKHFLVDSFDDEIHSFGSNFESDDHLYTVNLFSETKDLERITLPNCSVTQPLSGTKKSVYQEIERFCSLYVPRIKVYDANATSHYSYQRKFTLDSALQTRFNNIDCPEFQWNNPTLREVLNDLVSTDDCIIVVKEGIIGFYDLKQKGNAIDVSKLSFSKKSMSSQDYVGELTIDMQNAIGKSSSYICEGVTLRSPEGSGILTTENGVIRTLNPIYSIKLLKVKVPFKYTYNNNGSIETGHAYMWIDITKRVLEQEEFNLLSGVKIGGAKWLQLPTFYDGVNRVTLKKHKVNFLYFKRGGTEICNIGNVYDRYTLLTDVKNNFGENLDDCILSQMNFDHQEGSPQVGIGGNYDPRDFQFYLEYETLAEFSLHVGRNLPVKHPENRMFDNQANSYVDQEHMSIFEYAKVNRLGHKIRTICGDYYNESEIPQLGDYIGDEILFSREIVYQDNMLKFKGMLCPNYVLRDFFTGVRAKKRSWQIAKNEEALTRHETYKLYIETSFSEKRDLALYYDSKDIISISDAQSIVNTLLPKELGGTGTGQYLIRWGAAVYTEDDDGTKPSILLDSETSLLGRSICVNFGYNDNYKSADYIVQEDTDRSQSFYTYADSNGEFWYEYVLIHQLSYRNNGTESRHITSIADLYADVQDGYAKPKVDFTTIENAQPSFANLFKIKVYKDNREIIQQTLQFEFCSDTKNIILFDRFFYRALYKAYYSGNPYRIYLSPVPYKETDTEVKGTYDENLTLERQTINHNLECIRLRVKNNGQDATIDSTIKAWAITTNNSIGQQELLMAVNIPDGATVMECFFNLLRSRNDKIYSDNYNGIVVGDISDSGLANLDANYNAVTTRASVSVRIQGRNVIRSETESNNEENE